MPSGHRGVQRRRRHRGRRGAQVLHELPVPRDGGGGRARPRAPGEGAGRVRRQRGDAPDTAEHGQAVSVPEGRHAVREGVLAESLLEASRSEGQLGPVFRLCADTLIRICDRTIAALFSGVSGVRGGEHGERGGGL